jgi:hypothetical protein
LPASFFITRAPAAPLFPAPFPPVFRRLLVRRRPPLYTRPALVFAIGLAPLITAEHVETFSESRCAACAGFSDAPGSASFERRSPRPQALSKSARTLTHKHRPPLINPPGYEYAKGFIVLCRMHCHLLARAPFSSSAGSPARTARSAIAGLLHELPPKIFCPPYPLGQWNNEPTVAGF